MEVTDPAINAQQIEGRRRNKVNGNLIRPEKRKFQKRREAWPTYFSKKRESGRC
jgi:hypothetical protein